MMDFEDEEAAARGGPQPFVDRGEQPTRAGVVVPDVRGLSSQHGIDARKSEFDGLADAIGLDIVFSEIVKVREIKPATFVGGGTVQTLAERVKAEEIDLLLVDAALTAIQQRNLEKETGAKVLDRTGLILEIFGERAATREGVLQVELALLNYQKGRLVRSWTHLERQRGSGGYGFMGGPGETQIESDRRQISDRIVLLEDRLDKVRKTRAQQRSQRSEMPVVALVGYTNAGKSTLFNALTGSDVFAKDLLFATLDTTIRKLELPHGREVMLSDTVGFVADLPTDLVAAFRATLEEVLEADLILHIRDMSDPDNGAQASDVTRILTDLGIDDKERAERMVEVWNKIDRLDGEEHDAILQKAETRENVISVSAINGEGVDRLMDLISERLSGVLTETTVVIPTDKQALISWAYENAVVDGRLDNEDGSVSLDLRLTGRQADELERRLGIGKDRDKEDWER